MEAGTQTNYLNINMLLFGYRKCKLSLASFELLLDAFKFTSKKETNGPIMSAICLHGIERMAATNSREISYLDFFKHLSTYSDLSQNRTKITDTTHGDLLASMCWPL